VRDFCADKRICAAAAAERQGLIEVLVNPRKTFKKVLPKFAAQTRFRAIKSAPLFGLANRIRGKTSEI